MAITSVNQDVFNELINSNTNMTKKRKKQMLIYRSLLEHSLLENIENINMLYTKDLSLIAEFMNFIQYMSDAPEHIQQWLSDSIEESEKEDSEGIYLAFCNTTLKIKKMFDVLCGYQYIITEDDIFIDSIHVWVYLHE
jgi:hypothetical protein